MSSDTQTVPATVQDFTQCPNWGQGGQYVVDPGTGQRVLQGQPPAAPGALAFPLAVEQSEQPAAPVASDIVTTSKKEKTRG
jgi:hypothetical protein